MHAVNSAELMTPMARCASCAIEVRAEYQSDVLIEKDTVVTFN